jgi:AcrR family transcriptional regulator
MDAAVSVAEQEGLAGLTVARITAAAGHAKGTFYVHFPDRAVPVLGDDYVGDVFL